MNSTQTGIVIVLALAVIAFFFFFGGSALIGQQASVEGDPASGTISQESTTTMPTENTDKLEIVDEVVGTGAVAEAGDTVTVKYVGSFTNGTVFDASSKHQETANGFTFTLGAGNVIKGWDQGVAGMKEGGKRKLTIPSSLGYGPNDYGPIPGNSTLVFEVELVKVAK